jgi:hypothetical protein
VYCNEKDSSTFDLTVRPLSGAEGCGSAFKLLSSDGGAKQNTRAKQQADEVEEKGRFLCPFKMNTSIAFDGEKSL